MATNEEIKVIVTAEDKASGVLSKLGGNVAGLGKTLGALGIVAGGAIATGLALLGKTALSAASQYEQSKIAFETMLGSAEKAQVFLAQLTDFAKKTPFELTGLQDAAKSLLAYGIEQEKVLPNLKALGDIAAGVGMDKLPNLILAFGQVSAKGRLMGDDLKQFTSAGIPLLAQLAGQMGKTTAEISEMVTEGKIGFTDVETALTSLTNQGGRFENLMAKQSETFGGIVSNIKDTFGILMRDIGNEFLPLAKMIATAFMENLPAIKEVVFSVILVLKELAKTAFELGKMVIEKLKPSWDIMVAVFNEIVLPSLKELWSVLKEQLWPAVNELWIALQPFAPLVTMLAKVFGVIFVGALMLTIKILTDITTTVATVMTWLAKLATFVAKDIVASWDRFTSSLSKVIDALKTVYDWAKKAVDAIANLNVGAKVGGITGKIFGGGKASGGSVSAGTTYLVGERGAELFTPTQNGSIIPNHKLAGAGGGINISITGTFLSETAAMQMADIITDKLKLELRI